jgi:GTP-binding protein HflX
MNVLSKSDVFAENKLFATLDTTTRKVVLGHTPFLLSDTVGFIRKLPHHLIESFKSTLDEVREADMLLHVVDISHPQFEEQLTVVKNTLEELNIGEKPVITVFNKMDQYEKNTFDQWLDAEVKQDLLKELKVRWQAETAGKCVFISAIEKTNITELRQIVLNTIRSMYQVKYPYKAEFFY